MNIRAKGINDAWLKVLAELEHKGKESAPRGKRIKEVKNISVVIEDPQKRVLSLPIRNISLPFAFGEFIWYMSKRNDVGMMEYYSKGMKNFSDDGMTLNSAYGFRIFGNHPQLPFNQWAHVVRQLQDDPDTRQAVIHLHTPNNKKTKDEVCTLSLQFFIREGKLDMITNMRSNDIIKGFTYDVFSFTSMQELMANELGTEIGTYYHNAASMHIYESDFHYLDIINVIYPELIYMTNYDMKFSYDGLTAYHDDWEELFAAESLLRCTDNLNGISKSVEIKNLTLNLMVETLGFYRLYKMRGINAVLPYLQYDNLYHVIMRQYLFRNAMYEASSFTFVDGCDGAGKSSLIERMRETHLNYALEDKILNPSVIAFAKPEKDFNKLIYFQTSLLRGNVILDRFYHSEIVYSRLFERECRLTGNDVMILEKLLNFRDAHFVFMDTDYSICFSRLDEEDSKMFHVEQIKQLCEGYLLNWRVSDLKNKYRVITKKDI